MILPIREPHLQVEENGTTGHEHRAQGCEGADTLLSEIHFTVETGNLPILSDLLSLRFGGR